MKDMKKNQHPTFLRIAAYAVAILFGGSILIFVTSCFAALLLPQQIKSIFDMSPWNFPKLIAVYFGCFSAILFPFGIVGGWALIRLFTQFKFFERWAPKLHSKPARPSTASPSFPLQQILLSLFAAQKQGKSSTAFFHLQQFSELMRCQFGQDKDRTGAVAHARNLLTEIDALLGQGNLYSEEQEELTGEVTHAGEALRRIEI